MTDELTAELIEIFKNAPTPNPIEITYTNGNKSIYSKSILYDFYGADNVLYIKDVATNCILYTQSKETTKDWVRKLIKKLQVIIF